MDYALLERQLRALLGDEPDHLANAANFAAFVFHEIPDLNWAGFYYADLSGDLVLGPFQGRPACARLPRERGVCGAAFTSRSVLVVDDVAAFADHIVCDANSRSEIALPLEDAHEAYGVFDLDSPHRTRFAAEDRDGIARLVQVFTSCVEPPPWIGEKGKPAPLTNSLP
ncbi:MAG TPA: GAF domain-containing protein [Candidatus Tyrphobacter sp.]